MDIQQLNELTLMDIELFAHKVIDHEDTLDNIISRIKHEYVVDRYVDVDPFIIPKLGIIAVTSLKDKKVLKEDPEKDGLLVLVDDPFVSYWKILSTPVNEKLKTDFNTEKHIFNSKYNNIIRN